MSRIVSIVPPVDGVVRLDMSLPEFIALLPSWRDMSLDEPPDLSEVRDWVLSFAFMAFLLKSNSHWGDRPARPIFPLPFTMPASPVGSRRCQLCGPSAAARKFGKAQGTAPIKAALSPQFTTCSACPRRPKQRRKPMLGWAVTFLIIAIIAGVLGFSGIAGTSAGIAQILFVIFLILFLVSLLRGAMSR
jgi:uncharacterized membrane protein YtjA (UPF0391 family)